MPRLTRAESQAHTRDQLISTATKLFLRGGYSSTSLETVAEEAGYSKGAVYSNFRNKDELCLAVLDRIRADKENAITSAVAGAEGLDVLLEAFASWTVQTTADEAWMALETEYILNTRHDPQRRHDLAARNQAVRQTLTRLLTTHAQRWGVQLPVPAEVTATALTGLSLGIGLLRSADDDVDVDADAVRSVVRLLIRPEISGRPVVAAAPGSGGPC
jgi:AcrR family transcriptional regulator